MCKSLRRNLDILSKCSSLISTANQHCVAPDVIPWRHITSVFLNFWCITWIKSWKKNRQIQIDGYPATELAFNTQKYQGQEGQKGLMNFFFLENTHWGIFGLWVNGILSSTCSQMIQEKNIYIYGKRQERKWERIW